MSSMTNRGRVRVIVFAALLALLPTNALAQQKSPKSLPTKKDPRMVGKRDINNNQINFYSLRREIALGQQLAAQLDRQLPLLNDPVITEYVNRLGQNLVLRSDAKVPFTIKVVASDEVNAFALPGGFLYVNLGVLNVAETESEVAGVIAHEIAHVAARHALENLSKTQLLSLGAIPLIFIGGSVGELGRMGAELGLAAAFFKFSRGAEKEADELGAQYLWAAGYDPESLISFFEKLASRQQEVRVSPLFRSHPTTPDRIKNVRKLIARFPARETYIVNTREFASLKQNRLGGYSLASRAQVQDGPGERHPPVLRRRTSDDSSSGDDAGVTPSESPAESEPLPSEGRADGRQPPRIIRRTSPDSPTDEQLPAPPNPETPPGRPPVLIRQTSSGEPSSGSVLQRTPPILRRRF